MHRIIRRTTPTERERKVIGIGFFRLVPARKIASVYLDVL